MACGPSESVDRTRQSPQARATAARDLPPCVIRHECHFLPGQRRSVTKRNDHVTGRQHSAGEFSWRATFPHRPFMSAGATCRWRRVTERPGPVSTTWRTPRLPGGGHGRSRRWPRAKSASTTTTARAARRRGAPPLWRASTGCRVERGDVPYPNTQYSASTHGAVAES